ncbi:MAG: signal peptidase I [Polyangiales bacterium]
MKVLINALLWISAIVACVFIVGKLFFFEVATIEHNAMAPTLLPGDRILISKTGKPRPGRVTICEHPHDEGYVIGRVIATGGQKVSSKDGRIYVDDSSIYDKTGYTTDFYNSDTDETDTVEIAREEIDRIGYDVFRRPNEKAHLSTVELEPGQAYLMSDNRTYNGQDSRGFGPVDVSTCIGTSFIRVTMKKSDALSIDRGHVGKL